MDFLLHFLVICLLFRVIADESLFCNPPSSISPDSGCFGIVNYFYSQAPITPLDLSLISNEVIQGLATLDCLNKVTLFSCGLLYYPCIEGSTLNNQTNWNNKIYESIGLNISLPYSQRLCKSVCTDLISSCVSYQGSEPGIKEIVFQGLAICANLPLQMNQVVQSISNSPIPFFDSSNNASSCINFSPVCGNNLLEKGEQCDTGSALGSDGCSISCQIQPGFSCHNSNPFLSECFPGCGDGYRKNSESCDDHNNINGDGCSDICRIEIGSSCFGGSNTTVDACSSGCGDGFRNYNEECDDSNNINGDGCSFSCAIENGYECIGGSTTTVDACHLCGNGRIEITEHCDDGNDISGDGCDNHCNIESGYICNNFNLRTNYCSYCGNGILEGDEACDDGNRNDNDGCSSNCHLVDEGYYCVESSLSFGGALQSTSNIEFNCPMGWNYTINITQLGMSQANGAVFTISGKFYGSYEGESQIMKYTGGSFYYDSFDSFVNINKKPIQLNLKLDKTSIVVAYQTYTQPPPLANITMNWNCIDDLGHFLFPIDKAGQVCFTICGDAILGGTEVCDTRTILTDVNSVSILNPRLVAGTFFDNVGCNSDCMSIAPGFYCEHNPKYCDYVTTSTSSGNICYDIDKCETRCGDGILVQRCVNPNQITQNCEKCDDGNFLDGDGCSSSCQIEAGAVCVGGNVTSPSVCTCCCGNGKKQSFEFCDDGNLIDGDGCSSDCEVEKGFSCFGGSLTSADVCEQCGNKNLEGTELCDDGNLENGDGCSSSCQIEPGYICETVKLPAKVLSAIGSKPPNYSFCYLCGNGVLDFITLYFPNYAGNEAYSFHFGEFCDDGNQVSGDGCKYDCSAIEQGYSCLDRSIYLVENSTTIPMSSLFHFKSVVYGIEASNIKYYNSNNNAISPLDRNFEYIITCPSISKVSLSIGIQSTTWYAWDYIYLNIFNGTSNLYPVLEQISLSQLSASTSLVFEANQIYIALYDLSLSDYFVIYDRGGTLKLYWNCISAENGENLFISFLDESGKGQRCYQVCGDGIISTESNELCDDGNLISGDGCSSTCQIEENFSSLARERTLDFQTFLTTYPDLDRLNICGGYFLNCKWPVNNVYINNKVTSCNPLIFVSVESLPVQVYNNYYGSVETTSTDFSYSGCNSLSLHSFSEKVYSYCSNGVVEGLEECDDFNNIYGDGCSNCTVDEGYYCMRPVTTILKSFSLKWSSHLHCPLNYNLTINILHLDTIYSGSDIIILNGNSSVIFNQTGLLENVTIFTFSNSIEIILDNRNNKAQGNSLFPKSLKNNALMFLMPNQTEVTLSYSFNCVINSTTNELLFPSSLTGDRCVNICGDGLIASKFESCDIGGLDHTTNPLYVDRCDHCVTKEGNTCFYDLNNKVDPLETGIGPRVGGLELSQVCLVAFGFNCTQSSDCMIGLLCYQNICTGNFPVGANCISDSFCDSGYCNSGICIVKHTLSESCDRDAACVSGFCDILTDLSAWKCGSCNITHDVIIMRDIARQLLDAKISVPGWSNVTCPCPVYNGTMESLEAGSSWQGVICGNILGPNSPLYDGTSIRNQLATFTMLDLVSRKESFLPFENVVAIDLSSVGLNVHIDVFKDLYQIKFLQAIDLSSNGLFGDISPVLELWIGPNTPSILGSIDLSNNLLGGCLSSNIYLNSIYLMSLQLQYNKIGCSIPERGWWDESIYTLVASEVMLYKALLSGSIMLNISHNNINSTLPQGGDWNQARTFYIDFSFNYIQGVIPVQWLNLAARKISVTLTDANPFNPLIIFNAKTGLFLSNNLLIGPLPNNFIEFSNSVDLSFNQISSVIPERYIFISPVDTFAQTKSYTNFPITFDLRNNFLFSSLPFQWGFVFKLDRLLLSNNLISGELPISWSYINIATELDLSFNQIQGVIPPFWQSNPVILRLNNNLLVGQIPEAMGNDTNASSASQWYFQNNYFAGTLPRWSKMSGIIILDIHNCRIGGELPDIFSTMENLIYLDLSNNNIISTLPNSWANLKFISTIKLDGNLLTGLVVPPSWLVYMNQLSTYSVGNNLFDSFPLENNIETELLLKLKDTQTDVYVKVSLYFQSIPISAAQFVYIFCPTADFASCTNAQEFLFPGPFFFPADEKERMESTNLQNAPYFLNNVNVAQATIIGQNVFAFLKVPSSMRTTGYIIYTILYRSNAAYSDLVNNGGTPILNFCEDSAFGDWSTTAANLNRAGYVDTSANGCVKGQYNLTRDQINQIVNFHNAYSLLNSFKQGPLISALNGFSFNAAFKSFSRSDLLSSTSLDSIINLSVQDNKKLSGTFPSYLAKVSSKLANIDLSNTQLAGQIPFSWYQNLDGSQFLWKSLEYLNLAFTGFIGPLPKYSTTSWFNLKSLNLSNTNFSSIIPPDYSSAPTLRVLSLRNSNLMGNIPGLDWGSSGLTVLDLSDNPLLSGTLMEIPPSLLFQMNISMTNLQGVIPNAFSSVVIFYATNCRFLMGSNFSSTPSFLVTDFSSTSNFQFYSCHAILKGVDGVNYYQIDNRYDNFQRCTCSAGREGYPPFDCTLCKIGYYRESSLSSQSYFLTNCTSCPPFSTTIDVGASSEQGCLCDAGRTIDVLSSLQSDAEYYCKQCKPGYFKKDAKSNQLCEPCPFGQFASLPGASSCLSCVAGSYNDKGGQSVCTLCPPDTYSNITGSTTSKDCIFCPTFSGTNSNFEANDLSKCFCNIGYFDISMEGNVLCKSCSDSHGVQCSETSAGENLNSISLLAGYQMIMNNQNKMVVLSCPSDLACLPCTSNCLSASFSNTTIGYLCANGYEGLLCGRCIFGYFHSGDIQSYPFRCYSCEARLYLLILEFIFSVLISLIGLSFLVNQKLSKVAQKEVVDVKNISQRDSESNPLSETLSFDNDKEKSTAGSAESVAQRLAINHFQILTLISKFNIPWSQQLKVFFSIGNIFSSTNVLNSISIRDDILGGASKCLFTFKFFILPLPFQELMFDLYSMVIFSVMIIVFWSFNHFLCKKKRSKKIVKVTESLERSTPSSQEVEIPIRTKLIVSFIAMFFLFYSTILKSFFQLFSCVQYPSLDSDYRLEGALNVICFESEHKKWLLFVGVPVFVILIVGLPLSALLKLYSSKKANILFTTTIISKYGFLFDGYKPTFWWWEATILVRKILFSCIVVFVSSSNNNAQGIAACCLFFVYSTMHSYVQPYKITYSNQLEGAGLAIGTITLFLGLWLVVQNDIYSSIISTVIVLSLNVVWCAVVLRIILINFINKTVKQLQKLWKNKSKTLSNFCFCCCSKKKNKKLEVEREVFSPFPAVELISSKESTSSPPIKKMEIQRSLSVVKNPITNEQFTINPFLEKDKKKSDNNINSREEKK